MNQILVKYAGILFYLLSIFIFSISYWTFTLLGDVKKQDKLDIAIKSSFIMTIFLYLLVEIFRYNTSGFNWIVMDLIGSAFYVASVTFSVFVLWYAFFIKNKYSYPMRVGMILFIITYLYQYQEPVQGYFICCEGLAGFMLIIGAFLSTIAGAITFIIGWAVVFLMQMLFKKRS